MSEPAVILEDSLRKAKKSIRNNEEITTKEIQDRANYIVNCSTKSGIRAILACALAKEMDPSLDIRKPYTEIGTSDSYSGRTVDEDHVEPFVMEHDLPANQTTAWLTPAFRTNSAPLTPGTDLVGTPAKLYDTVIDLLDDVYEGRISAADTLAAMFKEMLILKAKRDERLSELLEEVGESNEKVALSSEEIVDLIRQHLDSPKSSRLPVLVVAAAYRAAEENLGETVKELHSHNAPDAQTGALGDVEITLQGSNGVVTSYEMKAQEVNKEDIRKAIKKINNFGENVDNYIFITTKDVDKEVQDYAKSLYRDLGGVEIVILDCIGFIRHFLHLFHRLRVDFIDAYQDLLLEQPDASVPQALKEIFLNLRSAAEEI
jgi:DNA adenine methylase